MNEPYRLPNEFGTRHYILRRVRMDDAETIFHSYATDATVTRFLRWKPHANVVDTAAFLKLAVSEWDQDKGFPVVAFQRQQPGDLMGMFHSRLNGHRVNYGYVLRASAWGKGCASEVMRWLVGHALSHPNVFRAEAFCDVDNLASARVMEKAGMTREGILRRYAQHPNISGQPRDCIVYSKVR
ncbi:GNAT family N-acetyltransferase [Paracoccus alkanivorans]|uniref:N-acetyltransferase n=1 Tax=Paracoccus alkanivorans TaxID=2116655 RepID=A0A3M0M9G1_9RHOB|nr:GNAT family protein [Paracoccus alkanivorans]RMC34416.1 N-acetyltransferase [Paracoccus alkanivorans]